MSDLRTAAQQAVEALEAALSDDQPYIERCKQTITALRAALAQQDEPRNQCGETCERAKLCATCAQVLAQQAEGGGNLPPPLQAEPVATVAENATTQQRVVETPPSDYRRGYWDGFNIGKREGRIEAEDVLAQQAEPQGCATEEDCTKQPWCRIRGECQRKQAEERDHYRNLWQKAQQDEPVQEPVGEILPNWSTEQERIVGTWAYLNDLGTNLPVGAKLYAAPPQRKQAEPVQEPVAEVFVRRDGVSFAFWLKAPPPERTKLYTAPPQRLPLTEEEIESCRQKGYAHAGLGAPFDFGKAARAVERAHGIKEN